MQLGGHDGLGIGDIEHQKDFDHQSRVELCAYVTRVHQNRFALGHIEASALIIEQPL